MEKIQTEFKCPYCGLKNKVLLEPVIYGQEIVNCDLENGGCEGMIVITYSARIDVTVHEVVGEKEIVNKMISDVLVEDQGVEVM